MPKLHLVIGDSHAKPGISNERFAWIAALANDRKPSVIVDIGDFADMPSLCSYDKGRKSFEGRRYANDIKTAVAARELVSGKIKYKVRKVSTLGNHEHRIVRAADMSPELEGTLTLDSLEHKETGWERYNYMEAVNVDGVNYSHCFGSGLMQRPVGGEHPAHSLIKTQLTSCVAGHSHLRDFCERSRPDGRRITAAFVGCYFLHNEEYAKEANKLYWRGLTLLHVHQDGHFDPEFISMSEVRRIYG